MASPRFLRDFAAATGLGAPADTWSGTTPSTLRPVVLGGCGRSGTTLLRMMLDSHRRICCGPESSVFRRRAIDAGCARRPLRLRAATEVAAIFRRARLAARRSSRSFAGLCMRQGGQAPMGGEDAAQHRPHRRRYSAGFPAARFVHVLRDGRDVACSLRTHPRHQVVDGKLVPIGTWKPIAGCARRWVRDIEGSRRWWGDPRFRTVRYEDLVCNPRPVLERLMAFLGEDWDEGMLAHAAADSPFRDATRFAQIPGGARRRDDVFHRPLAARPRRARPAHLQADRRPAAGRAGYAADDAW